MHLNGLDLNLLVLFRALMLHGKIARVADMLGLTPSAASHALSRLRRHYDDPLFLRVGVRMEPTSLARELAPVVEQALKAIEGTFKKAFDLKLLERQFHIGLVDFGALYLIPALLGKLATDAPRARVQADHFTERAALDRLERGELDLVIGIVGKSRKNLRTVTLFVDPFQLVVATANDAFGEAATREQLESFESIHIPFFERFEHEFARQGVTRPFGISTDNLLSAMSIVGQSKLVALMPSTVPRIYAAIFGVRTLPLPFAMSDCVVDLLYHVRSQEDPAQAWLREAIFDLAIELGSTMGTAKQLVSYRTSQMAPARRG